MIIHYENDTSYDKLFLYTDLFVKVFQTFCVCVCVCVSVRFKSHAAYLMISIFI